MSNKSLNIKVLKVRQNPMVSLSRKSRSEQLDFGNLY